MPEVPARRPAHPRRPPAHKSVSLRHSSPPGPQGSSFRSVVQHHGGFMSSNQANPPSSSDSKDHSSSVDSKPAHTKKSSGESSNADKWFERSNNQVKANTSNLADSTFLDASGDGCIKHKQMSLHSSSETPHPRPHPMSRKSGERSSMRRHQCSRTDPASRTWIPKEAVLRTFEASSTTSRLRTKT